MWFNLILHEEVTNERGRKNTYNKKEEKNDI